MYVGYIGMYALYRRLLPASQEPDSRLHRTIWAAQKSVPAVCMCVCVCMYVYMFICMYVYICVYIVCMYICMYICLYVCIYVCTYIY